MSDNLLKDKYTEKFEYIIANVIKKDVKHTVLIVDDEDDNLQFLRRTLRRDYNVILASNGLEALDLVEKHGGTISVVISDQRMPQMNGTDFLEKISPKYPKIIKMLLTGYTDIEAMINGVNKCGLFQYITKPVDPEELGVVLKRGINAYELTLSKECLLKDLKELFFTTIKSISSALDAKDTYTHGHSLRVTLFSLIIAKELNLDESLMEEIEIAGLLHDIGKIGVPESILCKPGKLTEEEYNIMKMHPERGKKILSEIRRLKTVAIWLHGHHERWDGNGYPQQLREKEIPFPSRILSIADTYDAMTSDRSYRKGLPHEVAYNEILNCSGSQFDPELVEIFKNAAHIFQAALADPLSYYDKYSVLQKIAKESE